MEFCYISLVSDRSIDLMMQILTDLGHNRAVVSGLSTMHVLPSETLIVSNEGLEPGTKQTAKYSFEYRAIEFRLKLKLLLLRNFLTQQSPVSTLCCNSYSRLPLDETSSFH